MSMSNFRGAIFDSLRRLARGAAHAMPQACALCAAPSGVALVCPPCEMALPRIGPACPRCALPSTGGAVCGKCLARAPPWGDATAAFAYAFPLDRLVAALKFRGVLAYADFFADALAACVELRPDALVAVPLAPVRQRKRGFNQADEIAHRLAPRLGLPVVHGLARVHDAAPQASSDRRDRARNVRGAFVALPVLAGRRVAIVDDVLTTGATLAAAAHAATRGGAHVLGAFVVARTLGRTS